MTAAPQDASADDYSLLAQACDCPVCRGLLPAQGDAPVEIVSSAGGPENAPLTSLPLLSSNPTATAKLFLDFNGHFESSWSFYSNVTTPAFSIDANVNDFSAAELAAIQEIWARVAEDYAPFNIDVTTIDPGHQTNRVVAVVAIGGSYTDWYMSSSAGVAFVNGFSNFSPNVGYVFSNNLSGNARFVAEAASHEAGHLFGLSHQARWTGTTLTEPYHSGNSSWAPIMGSSYSGTRSTWHNGTTGGGSTVYQDDLAILSGATNNFGYKADDFGSTIGTASALSASGTSVNFAGLIGRTDDQDVWSFTTTGGTVSFQLTGATYGSNLDSILELANSSGTILTSSAPTGSLGASFSLTVGAGTYYLIARGAGDYGNMGQYTITGSLPAASSAPTASLSVSGTNLSDGDTLAFGTTTAGTAVTRTITVTNTGNAVLTLSPLNAGGMPAGFTLVQNLQSTSLNPGASTTFIIRLDSTTAGSYSGQVSLTTNDSSHNPFTFQVSGTVNPAPVLVPSLSVSVGGSALTSGSTVAFGTTTAGSPVNRTFTITNQGNATLTLTSLSGVTLPAGFTLVQDLGSTSLAPGASTTFVLRLSAASAGSFSGQVSLLSNDAANSPFTFQVSGTVNAAPVLLPSLSVSVSGSALTSGGTVAFGSTTTGTAVNRTFTVTNQGNATLTLTSLAGVTLPAGFTLVQNFGSTSLAPGASTTFVLRLSAAAAGTFSGQVSLQSNDAANNPFTFQVSGTVTSPPVLTPSISVSVGGIALLSGGTLDFGTCDCGDNVARTLTITNTGTGTLTIGSLSGVTLPAGFTLLQNVQTTSLAPGAATTFVIGLSSTAAGSYSGQITLTSNDPANGSLSFTVSGTVRAPAHQATSDDANAGNRLVGGWKATHGRGYAGDFRTAAKGSGSTFSTWTFSNLPSGQYQVWVTWTAHSKNATNAPFTITSGGKQLKSVKLNQRVAPSGTEVDDVRWRCLGTVQVSRGNLIIKLTNKANGSVVADAVRIQQILPSGADLESIEYVGTGVGRGHTGAQSAFTARSEVHFDSLPLPATPTAQANHENASFSDVLELLSSPTAPSVGESAIDQVLAGEGQWSSLSPLLVS